MFFTGGTAGRLRYLFILLLSIPALANATAWTVWAGIEHVDITAPAGVSVHQDAFQDLLTKPLGNGGAAKVGRGRVMINGVGSAFNAVKTYSAQGIAKAAAAAMIGKGAPLIALSSIGLSYAFEELEGLRQPTKLVYPPNVNPVTTASPVPNSGQNPWCYDTSSNCSSSWEAAKSTTSTATSLTCNGPVYSTTNTTSGFHAYNIGISHPSGGACPWTTKNIYYFYNRATCPEGSTFNQSQGTCVYSTPQCPPASE